ncbi:MAG: type I secretion system permease/ATPase [Rhodospirillales bacterium]|nr:MAG: type I secretion system permease/ATPase [Rhodospirillales bacterium]
MSAPAAAPAALTALDRSAPDPLEAALSFLCRHFELPVSETAIRAGLAADVPGPMSLEQFLQAAAKAGLATAVGKQALADIRPQYLPLVALMTDGRAYVITRRIDAVSFAAFDPAFGTQPTRMTLSALEAGFSGYVVAVRPQDYAGADAGPVAESRAHWFWGPLKENSWTYTQVMLAAALTNLLGLTVSIFIMVVYDRVLPNEATESLIALTIGVVIALTFDFSIKMLRAAFIDSAGQKADLAMGARVFDHLLDMQMKTRRGSAGAFASTLREFETLRDFFASASLAALVDLPFILMFIGVIYLIGGPLAIVPALAVPAILILGVVIQPFLARYAEAAFRDGQTKQGVLVETIAGLETIKTSGAAPMMRKRWEDSIRHQSGVGAKTRRVSQVAINATASAQQFAQVGIVFLGVFLIAAGEVSMGALIACVILAGRTLAPLGQLAQTMTRINQARTSYRNLNTLMQEPTERRRDRRYVSRPRLAGKIEFRDVTFTYPGQSVPALKNVSFTIRPGEKVAVLGRIGSGKSTVMRLVLGLYEPDSGAILIDDTDLRQLDPADLRTNIAAVLQEVWLFTGTVRQNIAIGARRPTDDDIIRAATTAGLHDFIGQHPMGYDLVLAERGEGLSGGQKQSIALARALIAEAPVLVMDEPTSAMDMQTEQKILSRLKKQARDRTVMVITHRTSLLDLVDRVLILDGSRLVADGPKDILNRPVARTATAAEVASLHGDAPARAKPVAAQA